MYMPTNVQVRRRLRNWQEAFLAWFAFQLVLFHSSLLLLFELFCFSALPGNIVHVCAKFLFYGINIRKVIISTTCLRMLYCREVSVVKFTLIITFLSNGYFFTSVCSLYLIVRFCFCWIAPFLFNWRDCRRLALSTCATHRNLSTTTSMYAQVQLTFLTKKSLLISTLDKVIYYKGAFLQDLTKPLFTTQNRLDTRSQSYDRE
jgi:hypothetical protein